ncbi:MAG: VacB/RNase II family 3'-5' exoribonuclease, partial [Nitrospirae bacterium]
KDFDDAVSIKQRRFGYTLYVHIADVSHFVKEGSAIDREARKRGTSVYLPDRVIPMLPKKLSEDLCSLNPGVPRYAFTVEMDFSREGERLAARFYPSVIQSDQRMTYTEVKSILIDYDRELRNKYRTFLKDFELMAELCNILRSMRLARGSLDFDLPEPEVLLDLRGNPEAIIAAERNFAHMIIEEFMIAANEAVAEYLEKKGVPSIYRVHEGPDPEKIASVLGIIQKMMKEPRRILVPENLPEIIAHFRDRSEEDVVNYMILRTLKQAKYSPTNIGHFGLASRCYTHFTSPIRRYPDLVVHRILREVLKKKRLSATRLKELEEMLPAVSFHCSKMERLADEVERTVVDAMRAWFMKQRVGDEFQARVVGVTSQGLKIRLKEYYVEGFLHVSYMTDDYYIFDEDKVLLFGKRTRRRFTLGDTLTVRLDRVDIEGREIVFGLPESKK